jgi:uncharacterized membrane protein YgdD (TMEM256/DUF423 family)
VTARSAGGLGALLGFLAVALGAFGAHALRSRVPPALVATFETGVRYQMYHALALLACAWALERDRATAGHGPRSRPMAQAAAWLFLLGIVFFSGSLYALVLSGQPWWGAVTPLGGLAFLAGWACLAWALVSA